MQRVDGRLTYVQYACLTLSPVLTHLLVLRFFSLQHVCADTLRSSAVLVAAIISFLWPDLVSGELADSMATVVVSVIILVSLVPLLNGLFKTSRQIVALSTDPTRPIF